jgi:hypothetical protein
MGTDIVHGTERLDRRGDARAIQALAASAGDPSSLALTTLEQSLDHALVKAPEPEMRPKQLSWNGVRVSEELARYAAAVARGEELAPYRGPVLARRDAAFPWNLGETPTPVRARRAEPSWSGWQLLSVGVLAIGVLLGGVASFMADGDEDSGEIVWNAAHAGPPAIALGDAPLATAETLVETAPIAARLGNTELVASKANAAARAVAPARTITPARTVTRAKQPTPSVAASTSTSMTSASASNDAALFVEAPSF